jgi:hypothetical protein
VVGAGLGDRREDAGVVDDVFALGIGGQEGVAGEVVDLAGLAAEASCRAVSASSANSGSSRPARDRWFLRYAAVSVAGMPVRW